MTATFPLSHYIPSGTVLDEVQLAVINILEDVANVLENHSFLDYFRASAYKKSGIFLYGGVGRGKTMVMKAFYQRVEVKKQFIHYQAFMQSVHQNIHQLQTGKLKGAETDKILSQVAKTYANEARILCLDELEIKDIADAMIIGRLFRELIKNKVFICVTSNTRPQDLYLDGLQRELFLPFITMLHRDFEILQLENNHDYRLDKVTKIANRVFYPLDLATKKQMMNIITELTGNELRPTSIEVFGRCLTFSKTHKNTLVTNFDELCLQELGYADYVNICKRFSIIILENVPIINTDNTDVAIRFINFIDNAYFNKVLVFISLQTEPRMLYQNGKRSLEFMRTISRLSEMNSQTYLETRNND